MLRRLKSFCMWFSCFIISCWLLVASPLTQAAAVGLATVPITQGVGDPHARVFLFIAAFVGISWLALNVAELAALLVTFELRKALQNWVHQVRCAKEMRAERRKS